MTVLIVVVLIVWLIGIAGFTAAAVQIHRSDPLLGAAFATNPVYASLVLAVVAVGWPGAVIAAALNRLMERGAR